MTRRWGYFVRAAILLTLAMVAGACSARMPIPIKQLVLEAPKTADFDCKEDEFRIDLLGAVGALPDDTLDPDQASARATRWECSETPGVLWGCDTNHATPGDPFR
jgi:hypothetical protein